MSITDINCPQWRKLNSYNKITMNAASCVSFFLRILNIYLKTARVHFENGPKYIRYIRACACAERSQRSTALRQQNQEMESANRQSRSLNTDKIIT